MQDFLRAFMNQQSRNLCRIVVLWAVLSGPVVSGADDDDDGPAEEVQRNREIVIDELTVDLWIFQENQGRKGIQSSVTAAAARARIDSQLKAMLDELGQVSSRTQSGGSPGSRPEANPAAICR
jgi:hypothetical protein